MLHSNDDVHSCPTISTVSEQGTTCNIENVEPDQCTDWLGRIDKYQRQQNIMASSQATNPPIQLASLGYMHVVGVVISWANVIPSHVITDVVT